MARAIQLIVEDGSIVTDANSFVTEDQIVTYAAMRGIALPYTTDAHKDAVAVLGIKAVDYLRVLSWRGELVDPNQTMPWPRKNLSGNPTIAEDAIPPAVLEAQFQLVLLVNGGTDLLPTSAGTGFVIKEKVGPIETLYSEKVGISTNGLPILPGITGLLDPWLLGDFTGIVPVLIRSIGDAPYGE